jgi:hypothetical protein
MFPREWLSFLAEAVEEAMASPGPNAEEYARAGGGGRFFGDLELAERLPKFRRFALESPAAEIAGRIMGATRVNFFYDQLLVKEPGTPERTPWHQDQPYWAVSGSQVCSLWLPLDSVSEEVGVEYVCGSHRWPEFSPYHFKDGTLYEATGLPPLPRNRRRKETGTASRFRDGAGRRAGVPGDDRARLAGEREREPPSSARDAVDGRRRSLPAAPGRGRDTDEGSRARGWRRSRLRAISPGLERRVAQRLEPAAAEL